MIIAGTGHRPPKLGLGYEKTDNDILVDFITTELERILKTVRIDGLVSGMATGFDQALAEAALALSLPLTAAVPFEGMEAKWPASGKRRFTDIIDNASRVVVVEQGGYANWKFASRDRWLVDNSDGLLALFDESEVKSGTGITVAYARGREGYPVYNTWSRWLTYRSDDV